MVETIYSVRRTLRPTLDGVSSIGELLSSFSSFRCFDCYFKRWQESLPSFAALLLLKGFILDCEPLSIHCPNECYVSDSIVGIVYKILGQVQ